MPEKWSKKNQTSAGGRKYRFCKPIRCTKSTWWWIFPTPLICVCKSKIAVAQPTKKIFLCLSKNLSEKFWSNISEIKRQNFFFLPLTINFSEKDREFFKFRIQICFDRWATVISKKSFMIFKGVWGFHQQAILCGHRSYKISACDLLRRSDF